MASAWSSQPFLDAAVFAAITLIGRPVVIGATRSLQRRYFPERYARRKARRHLLDLLNELEGLPGEETLLLETLATALGIERAGLYAREPRAEELRWQSGTHRPNRERLSLERAETGTALVEGYATGLVLTGRTGVVGYLILGGRPDGKPLPMRDRGMLQQTCEQLTLVLENRWLGRTLIDEQLAAHKADEDRILQERVNAVVSHQLKTPLLLGQSMLTDARRSVSNRKRVAKRLDKIAAALARFERNVIQNLDRHRLAEGPFELEVAPTELSPLIERCLDEVRYVLGKRGASTEVHVAPDLQVLADGPRLEIVLDNLIGNALKVLPEGGRLGLAAARIGDRIRLDVSDDGPGIPPARLAGLFGVQPPNPEDPTSTGFGLAICRDYLVAMGGSIELLDNGPGGVTFRLELRGVDSLYPPSPP